MSKVSVTSVVPVYSGNDFLEELVARLKTVRDQWKSGESPLFLREAIFVNDGSADGSFDLLEKLQHIHSWITIVNLSRNYGQHQATIAGVLHSSGDWIVTLDEDLQHDPALIEDLIITAINEDADIVYANPKEAVHQNLFRDMASKLFKSLVATMTGNPHIQKFNSFRLIRGTIARAAAGVCSHGTYFDIALCWFTDRVTSVQLPLTDIRFVETGQSGYTLRKLLNHARLLIMSSEAKVARLGAALGLMIITLSIILGSVVLFDKLLSPESIPVEGWTSLFLAMLFSTGLLTTLLSIVLEYISILVLHIQGKPTFFVVDRGADQVLIEHFTEGHSVDTA